MNSLQDIDDRYNKSITALKSLEQILKVQEANYETHITRLGWLKHLADACADLRRLDIEFFKISQAAMSKAAINQQTAVAPPNQPVVQPEPEQVEESAQKKAKKKL